MALLSHLAEVRDYLPDDFADLRRNVPAEWIEAALQATGTATLRRRRLPAEQVLWLVIGIALMRQRSIVEVAAKLDLALPAVKPTVAPSTVAQARARVGDEPLAWLFGRCAEEWAHSSAARDRWRGLALYSVDGTKFRVPDTRENVAAFGKFTGAAESAFPLLRLVTLMALRSHLLAAATFGTFEVSEHAYADSLWAQVPDRSLVILDRLYFSVAILAGLSRSGQDRHWLLRAKKNLRSTVLRRLAKGDAIVELRVSPEARENDPSLGKTWTARAITYRRKGFRDQILLTSLTDHVAYPQAEIVRLYHERWEIELGYDEIKTELLEKEPVLRSKSPTLVNQEMWGILLAYNLVRLEMERVAADAGVSPIQISFTAALHYVIDEWLWCAIASPGAVPRHLHNLRTNLVALVLPKRRPDRRYPRAVKVQRGSSFPKAERRRAAK
jgi:hypothetical protein